MKTKVFHLAKLCGVLAAVAFGVATVSTSFADSANSSIISPDSAPYGRTFAEWQTAWQQWALSIPVTIPGSEEIGSYHPLFEGSDPSIGQTGPVFFLGGKFCSEESLGTVPPECNFENVVRTITVPAGKALFLPVINYETSALEETQLNPENPPATINYLRTDAQNVMDFVVSEGVLLLEVDGKTIKDLGTKHRGQSTVFSVTLPEDNVWESIYSPELEFPAGLHSPSVDDGIYVMLKPWPANGQQHVIHFRAEVTGFVLDVTYYITVE